MSNQENYVFDEEQFHSIMLKSVTDDEFRQALLSNPKAVLVENGAGFPSDVDFKVVELKSDEVIIPLPPYMGDRLPEDQLESVAGGIWSGNDVKAVLDGAAGAIRAIGDMFKHMP